MANDQREDAQQWDPNVFVARDEADRSTCTHIRGFYGDEGENESVLCVIAHHRESPMYPESGRIFVGTPQRSPLMEGYFPELGSFSCSVETMKRFVRVAQKAIDDVEAAVRSGR